MIGDPILALPAMGETVGRPTSSTIDRTDGACALQPRLIACLFLASSGVAAEPANPAQTVVACDNLVTLRRLMMAPEAEGDAIPAAFGGCRAVPQDQVGAVDKRAMIGDAPYECRTIKEGPCLWVRP